MEIVEVECANCNKKIYIQEEYVREKMFCTLGCLESYTKMFSMDSGLNTNSEGQLTTLLYGTRKKI